MTALDHAETVPPEEVGRLERLAAWAPWFLVAFVGCNFVIRLLISPNLEWDEAEFVGHIDFAFGYPNSHPPLYTWLVAVSYRLTGNWPLALAIPKNILLVGTYLLVFDLIRRLTGRNLPAAIAAGGLLMVPEIVYYSEYTRTHSVLAICAAAASLHAVVLIVRNPRLLHFAWLGIALGAGMLAKYNFAVFAAALILAIAATPEIRRAVFVRKFIASLAILAAMVLPHAIWALNNPDIVAGRFHKLARLDGTFARFDIPGIGLDGLATLGVTLLTLCAILAVVWMLGLFIMVRAGKAAPVPDAAMAPWTRLFGLTFLIGIFLIAAFILAADIHNVRPRYLTPIVVALPVWLTLRWPIDANATAAGRFVVSAALGAAFVTVLWPVLMIAANTPYSFPFRQMAAEIEKEVELPVALWGRNRVIYGNLAIQIDGAEVWDERDPAERVLIAWYGTEEEPLPPEFAPLYRPVSEPSNATFPMLGPRDSSRALSWQLYELNGITSGAGKTEAGPE